MTVGGSHPCPTLEVWAAFPDNVTTQESAALRRHLADCSVCRRLVAEVARYRTGSVESSTASSLGGDDTAPEFEPIWGGALPFREHDPTDYRIEAEHGRGGLGRVLAARDLRLGRVVALKEMLHDRPDLQQRFAREALITARLEHPGIVPVYEAGMWPGGKPYYAMKLVHGRSLGQLIDARPTLEERLPLVANVMAVADALAYAHSKGVIHRDLKPANAIVGDYGETVVIDWGLAKGVGDPDDLDDAGGVSEVNGPDPLTRHGAVLGTPAYMPPEQARGEQVDRRADVYALGAILYHVLAGRPPYTGASPDDVLRQVTDGSPAPLDALVSLRADLVAVVHTAMARDRSQRYADADELRDELQRYQAGNLVRAHQYPFYHRTLRRLRRSMVPVVLTAAVIAAVGAAAVFGVRQYRIAQQTAVCTAQGDRINGVWNEVTRRQLREGIATSGLQHGSTLAANAIPWFEARAQAWRTHARAACLNETVLETWDAAQAMKSSWCLESRRAEFASLVEELVQADATVAAFAVKAASGLSPVETCTDEASLAGFPPAPGAERRDAIASVQREVAQAATLEATGQFDAGAEVARAARVQAEALGWLPLVAAAQRLEAQLLGDGGDIAAGEKAAVAAYLTATRVGSWGEAAAAATDLIYRVGALQSRYAEGALWGEHAAVAIAHAGDPIGYREAARLMSLGGMLNNQGAFAEAKKVHEQALAAAEAGLGPDHPMVAGILTNLANACNRTGDYARAAVLHERALKLTEQTLEPGHPRVATLLNNLANVHKNLGHYSKAKALHRQALTIRRRRLNRNHVHTASSLVNLAIVHRHLGELDAAVALQKEALPMFETVVGPEHQYVALTLNNLGTTYLLQQQEERALPLFRRALAILEKSHGSDDYRLASVLCNIAQVHQSRGRSDRAVPLYQKALALDEAKFGPKYQGVVRDLVGLGQALSEQGAYAAAAPHLERAAALADDVQPELGAQALFRLAMVLWNIPQGRDRTRARRLALDAQNRLETLGSAERDLQEVSTWLRERVEARAEALP